MGTGVTAGPLAKTPIKTYRVHIDADENITIDWPQSRSLK